MARKFNSAHITTQHAESKLDKIQFGKKPVGMKLKGVPVAVKPLSGNAFEIKLTMTQANAREAAMRLNDIGADIKPWPAKNDNIVKAIVTWDTALHYLMLTGDLV